jgi:beta-glucosidase
MERLKFPKNFLWGSATSAHQIEGNNRNDWSEWEISDERIKQIKKEGKDPGDFISSSACDSWQRYKEDLDIAKQLNQKIYRFSIEWSRIEPEEGKFSHEAVKHYKDIVKAIRERGMEPMVTLWHFTNPIWFSKGGGFLNNESPEAFVRFVRFVADNLKNEVALWITFNEGTSIYSGMSYLRGIWPPQHKCWRDCLKVSKNIVKAHILAYETIKKIYSLSPASNNSSVDVPPGSPAPLYASHNIKEVQVGVVENNTHIIIPWCLRIIGLGKLVNYFRNHFLFSRASPHYDFIGLNYYNILRMPGSYLTLPRQQFIYDMGWEIYPRGIYYVLRNLEKFNKPIYITENGVSDPEDSIRRKFIKNHLYWVWRAIQDGVDVRGYMYWSLLDNFEWHHGYAPRFGLVEIDRRNNLARRIRPSAFEYAKICLNSELEID